MPELHFKTYDELERYLRGFSTWHRDEAVYDVGGAFGLLRALLQNLKERSLAADIEQYAPTLSQEEIAFLERLVSEAKNSKRSDM